MNVGDDDTDTYLDAEERAAVAALTATDVSAIDSAILAQVRTHWQKTALVVVKAMYAYPDKYEDIPDVFYGQRVIALTEGGAIEASGDLLQMRLSEIRLSSRSALLDIVKKYAGLDMFEGYDIRTPVSPGPDGDTPFHMAVYDGDIDAVKTMLPYVADINLAGDIGNTALHYAVSNKQIDMAQFLIATGADLRRKNEYGDTPLDYMEGSELFCDVVAQWR
jgi:hypothetical protein